MRSHLEAHARRSVCVPSLRLGLALAVALASAGCGTSSGTTPASNPGSNPGSGPGSNFGPSSATDGGAAVAIPCATANIPSTLSGFMTCACFNGTFTLTQATSETNEPPSWSSPAVTGCPGQQDTAYLKLSDSLSDSYDSSDNSYVVRAELGFGITDAESEPGSGNSDFAPATDVSCAPFAVSGAGSQAGNITAFCPGTEDENMKWSITE